jgi:hypothetical protein
VRRGLQICEDLSSSANGRASLRTTGAMRLCVDVLRTTATLSSRESDSAVRTPALEHSGSEGVDSDSEGVDSGSEGVNSGSEGVDSLPALPQMSEVGRQ